MANRKVIVEAEGRHRETEPGDVLLDPDGAPLQGNPTNLAALSFVFNGGLLVIPTGVHGELQVPFNCEILSCVLTASKGTPGDLQIDILKSDFAGYPGGLASITGGSHPAIVAGSKYEDSTLTGWTTTINQGDLLQFSVDSAAGIQQATVSLTVNKLVTP